MSGEQLNVAAFTGSMTVSSRRFRVLQYTPRLAELGITIHEYVARLGSWAPRSKLLRPAWLVGTVVDRIPSVLRSHRYDMTLLQREMVATLVTLEPFTRRPRVLDVDDAIWLNGERSLKSFAALAGMCDGVMCGNDFIAENVARWNRNTLLLPTAVDTDRFRPSAEKPEGRQIIGWSGLHAGAKYLLQIEDALFRVLSDRRDCVLRIVSDVKPAFRNLSDSMIEFVRWSPENEVRSIQDMAVGLMPIDDSLWSRGKCSYKMLLYMACGVPVVVSPFGMNRDVIDCGEIGFGVVGHSQWIDALHWLLDHPDKGREMGNAGRHVVEERYSLSVLAPIMGSYLLRWRV